MAKKKLKEKISSVLELPQELVADVPRLVLDSNTDLWIENYKGIIEYTDELVRVNTACMPLSVTGTNLMICSITAEELHLCGEIASVSFMQ